MLKSDLASFALDHPNDRSLHRVPVPRTGGLALMVGILFGWAVLGQLGIFPTVGCVLFMMLISLVDDLRGLSAGRRLLAQFLAAGTFMVFGLAMNFDWLWFFPIVIATVWMTNLYNFMDGSDGLAGGMALFGFGSYGFTAWLQGDMVFAGQCWSVVAASLAFLLFNFHPARIFMGDAGSIPLGFLAAVFGLLGWRAGYWPLWFPAFVFSPFILDASVTLTRRLLRGEKIWQAHREHYYQRLVQMGWGHRRTALVEYALMAGVGLSATWAIAQDGRTQLIFIISWGVAYLLAMWLVDVKWSRIQRQSRC